MKGIKDKDHLLKDLVSHDIMFLQEHLMVKVSISILERSLFRNLFTRKARKIKGCPSGGLAILIHGMFMPSMFHSDDNILMIQWGNLVLVNLYLPWDHRSISDHICQMLF